MKKLEDHLRLVCQMVKEEHSNYHSFLRRLKKKAEWLSHFPDGLLLKGKGVARKEERRPHQTNPEDP